MADSSQHLVGGTAQDGDQIAFTSVSYKALSKDYGSNMPANITYSNNAVRDGLCVRSKSSRVETRFAEQSKVPLISGLYSSPILVKFCNCLMAE
jgi:hypothetical protein